MPQELQQTETSNTQTTLENKRKISRIDIRLNIVNLILIVSIMTLVLIEYFLGEDLWRLFFHPVAATIPMWLFNATHPSVFAEKMQSLLIKMNEKEKSVYYKLVSRGFRILAMVSLLLYLFFIMIALYGYDFYKLFGIHQTIYIYIFLNFTPCFLFPFIMKHYAKNFNKPFLEN